MVVFLPVFSSLEQPAMAPAQTTERLQVAAYPLPPISIKHLQTLTDATGIHEFAHGTIPWREDGYCAEDVGRALAAVTVYEQVTGKTDGRPLARVYLAYLQKSLRDDGEIWNREDQTLASGDAYGRILWGLGCAASFQTATYPDREVATSAAKLFDQHLSGLQKKKLGMTTPTPAPMPWEDSGRLSKLSSKFPGGAPHSSLGPICRIETKSCHFHH